MSEWIGLIIACAIVAAVGVAANSRGLAKPILTLLLAALALRILGGIARYEVLAQVYGGVGDANTYFRRGLVAAGDFWQLELLADHQL